MRKTLLLVLSFSGLCALSTNFLREYHYVNISTTWDEAKRYCRKMFTELAAVDNQDDNNKLLSVTQDHGEYAWIGLYDKLKWTLGKTDFNESSFSNWRHNSSMGNNCVIMSQDGLWRYQSCGRKRPAVCFYDKGPSMYILVENRMSWFAAKQYCRSHYTDLAIVRNMSENNNISSLLSSNTWIGLFRCRWTRWSDWSHTTFTNWNDGQPNNSDDVTSCAAVNTITGTWRSVDCEEKHHFICQNVSKRVQHKTTFKLRFQSQHDLKDPAIQQQILDQLHAKLKTHQLPDFKLRWIQTDGQTFLKEDKKKKEGGQ